ncbi:MAG: peptidylprolyl isomerase [Candidatus Uhrbacteria bacterium]
MTAILKTNFGDITVELFDEETQKTVENFVQLAGVHFYDGTQFHRVIPGFMIQGGDPNTIRYPDNLSMHGRGDPGYKFEDEITERKLVRGSLAMANSGPNTNGSQFFIVTAEAVPWLDGLHTNFGQVIAGMDVVDRIEAVERDANDHPIQPVVLNSTEIVVGE